MTASSDSPRIALIHALPESVPAIAAAFHERWPEAETFNLLDDSLSRDVARDGAITEAMTQRFVGLTRYAVDTGAQAVQFTCSAFNSCIDVARNTVSIPVLKPDEAMVEEALTYGPRLGVVVTFAPSIDSCREQIEAHASALGVQPMVEFRHAAGALEALRADDAARHDQLIAAAANELAHCDVVMLAQYSMARAAATIELPHDTPLLTSPGAAVDKLKSLLT